MAVAFCAGALSDCHGGTVTFSIGMGDVLDNQGQKIATTGLFQLVCLGANGVFDPIPPGAWVGGDDTVVGEAFANSDGWISAAAFDLANGTGAPGQFTRQFTFKVGAGIKPGDKLGIRWFPTVTAANSATTAPVAGMPYGQFTRQSSPLYGGSVWVVPAAGGLVSFDPLLTISYDPANGKDPNSAGAASALIGFTTIESWRQTYFGSPADAGNGLNSFDFAHDGVPNLVKYAFGLDPTRSNANSLPQPRLIGGNWVISFAEPAGVLGVSYGAEWSSTLLPADWHAISDTGSGTQHIFSVSKGSNTRMFVRNKVMTP